MEITRFSSTRLRNAEHISLADDVIKITQSYDWTAANVQNLPTWVQETNTELKDHINKLGTVNETVMIKLADDAFNNAWRALKHVVKAYLLSPIVEKRASAAIVSELINSHGPNLHNESYQVQNATAKLFINDCNTTPEIMAAIAQINLGAFVTNIETALETLIVAIKTRKSKTVSEQNESKTREIRNRLADHLTSMFKYLEVMSQIAPGGDLDTMIKKINESILKIETAVKKRTNKTQELEGEQA